MQLELVEFAGLVALTCEAHGRIQDDLIRERGCIRYARAPHIHDEVINTRLIARSSPTSADLLEHATDLLLPFMVERGRAIAGRRTVGRRCTHKRGGFPATRDVSVLRRRRGPRFFSRILDLLREYILNQLSRRYKVMVVHHLCYC